ncbi:hypothetical protein ABEB36_002664 [Hypothenemus hampei]|uniref:Uncharacterized protein n=1 Tax=Hypothenemus hampei TaxID=57062 RepID=A0ABD1F6L5_HYPHA
MSILRLTQLLNRQSTRIRNLNMMFVSLFVKCIFGRFEVMLCPSLILYRQLNKITIVNRTKFKHNSNATFSGLSKQH